MNISFEVIDGCSQVSVSMITSGLTECAICWSSCSLFLQDGKFMFTMRRGLLNAVGRMVCGFCWGDLVWMCVVDVMDY